MEEQRVKNETQRLINETQTQLNMQELIRMAFGAHGAVVVPPVPAVVPVVAPTVYYNPDGTVRLSHIIVDTEGVEHRVFDV
jgi:hypothetical protein